MAWEVVPNLLELREQVNKIAPNRDKASDGTIGDYKHSHGVSSHNPDDTGIGNAEWENDPDGKEEVRALDLDVDFNRPGLTANKLVSHLIKYAKNGTFWWIRYIIYNRKMYHKRNNFEPVTYGGTNPHTQHIHINSDFSQSADNVKNVNYRLNELVENMATQFNSDDQAVLTSRATAGVLGYAGGGLPSWDGQPANRNFLNAFVRMFTVVEEMKVQLDALEGKIIAMESLLNQLTQDPFDGGPSQVQEGIAAAVWSADNRTLTS